MLKPEDARPAPSGSWCVGLRDSTSCIGILAYLVLSAADAGCGGSTRRRSPGYYGSDSAGTFVTCLGVLATAHDRLRRRTCR